MKPERYKDVLERLEQIKRDIPYLEKSVKSRSIKKIEDSIAYIVYHLHKMHKEATEKSTMESIQELTNRIWWFKMQKDKEVRKYLPTKKQYSIWAKKYDLESNIAIYLEEKYLKDWFSNLKDKEVLDFGCGTGRYTIPFAKKGALLTAIDFTPAMMNKAKKKAKKERLSIDFSIQDITKYNPKKKFDLIISMLVFDHIDKLEKPIEVIEKASKIGTEVIITTIHPEAMRENADLKTGRAQGYVVEGYKTDQFFHPTDEYVDVFLKHGFILTKTKTICPLEEDVKSKERRVWKAFVNKPGILAMKFQKVR